MRRLIVHLGLALAACLSMFSFSALAEPIAKAYRTAYVVAEPHSVALTRMELTLAVWRTGSQDEHDDLASNLRASSNHFEMASAKLKPERDVRPDC